MLDLDGSLLKVDLLYESVFGLIRAQPLAAVKILLWLCRGIAFLKHKLAIAARLDCSRLPINRELAEYARAQAATGRTVVVATAANVFLARKVCEQFEFVQRVYGSDERINLKGRRKLEALRDAFPEGFSYAGDSRADLRIWAAAETGIFAGRNRRIRSSMARLTPLEADLGQSDRKVIGLVKAMRLHQWVKNGLVFLPFLLAGKAGDVLAWFDCVIAFFSLSLMASGTYLINDLVDLDADRQHWSKRNRAFAAGQVSVVHGLLAAAALIAASGALALAFGSIGLVAVLGAYCALTLLYSAYLKRVPLLDTMVLAGLFTLRLALGSIATDVRLSTWLVVFSMFLFTSLALAKRSVELHRSINRFASEAAEQEPISPGRGYVRGDAILVTMLGVATTVAAVLVMVLYLMLDAYEDSLYVSPQALWVVPVTIGLWLGRVWLLTNRGALHDDPVIFAVKDRVSIGLGLIVLASFAAAAII